MFALIALAFGLVSVFLSAGLAAIIFGVIALFHIRRSGDLIKGRRMARIAILLPFLMVLFPMVLDDVNRVRAFGGETRCQLNLNLLGKAMMAYFNEHDVDRFPEASRWCDLLMSTGKVDLRTFQCPGRQEVPIVYPMERYAYLRRKAAGRSKERSNYAMNEHANSPSVSPDTVLLFDAKPGWNQTGGPEALVLDNHRVRGCSVLFADLSTDFIRAEDIDRLKWE